MKKFKDLKFKDLESNNKDWNIFNTIIWSILIALFLITISVDIHLPIGFYECVFAACGGLMIGFNAAKLCR